MRIFAALLALTAATASASEPEGATPEQRAAFTAAAQRLGTGWDAARASCIADTVAREDGPVAIAELVGLTTAAADGQGTADAAALQFVSRHGDAYYGIVAACQTENATGN